MNPIAVLRETEGGRVPALAFADHEISEAGALNVACAWLERAGADQWTVFTAREEGGDHQVRRLWWSEVDASFVAQDHEDAVPVTVVRLPGVTIPDDEAPAE